MKLDRLSPLDCWQLSSPDREAYHRRLLLSQLEWATERVPFYRGLRLSLAELRRADLTRILAALPVINKEMILNRNPAFLAHPPLSGCWGKTGGSTGEPTEIYHDREQLRWGTASVEFARGWWGAGSRRKCLYAWGHSASLAPGWAGAKDRLLRPIKDYLRNRLRIDAYRQDVESLRLYVHKLKRFQPTWILGYSSSIYLLAQQFREEGCLPADLRGLCAVICTADPCYPFQARVIEAAFGAPVAIEYGSAEVGVIAHSHPDGTFRILQDRILVETSTGADGLPRVIVTDLSTRSQPLIRFNIADFCQTPVAEPPNGRGFRVLGTIEGRVLDSIIGENGRRLHGVALSHIVNACYPSVSRYRFHQSAGGRLRAELQLKPSKKVDRHAEGRLISYLQDELGPIPVEITYFDSFPASPSGKFRWVVSEMQQAGPRDGAADAQ